MREWPFRKQPPESIIWQVGKGMKQSLTQIQASRDVKVISLCDNNSIEVEQSDISCFAFLVIDVTNCV